MHHFGPLHVRSNEPIPSESVGSMFHFYELELIFIWSGHLTSSELRFETPNCNIHRDLHTSYKCCEVCDFSREVIPLTLSDGQIYIESETHSYPYSFKHLCFRVYILIFSIQTHNNNVNLQKNHTIKTYSMNFLAFPKWKEWGNPFNAVLMVHQHLFFHLFSLPPFLQVSLLVISTGNLNTKGCGTLSIVKCLIQRLACWLTSYIFGVHCWKQFHSLSKFTKWALIWRCPSILIIA